MCYDEDWKGECRHIVLDKGHIGKCLAIGFKDHESVPDWPDDWYVADVHFQPRLLTIVKAKLPFLGRLTGATLLNIMRKNILYPRTHRADKGDRGDGCTHLLGIYMYPGSGLGDKIFANTLSLIIRKCKDKDDKDTRIEGIVSDRITCQEMTDHPEKRRALGLQRAE